MSTIIVSKKLGDIYWLLKSIYNNQEVIYLDNQPAYVIAISLQFGRIDCEKVCASFRYIGFGDTNGDKKTISFDKETIKKYNFWTKDGDVHIDKVT